MKELLEKYKNNEISLRSLISTIKNNDAFIRQIILLTSFLDEYNPDILERIYYIINDLYVPVKCKYCDNKAKWSGRIKDGYKMTCCSKECESKRMSEQKTGSTVISSNRDNAFIEWQNSITKVNDDIIKTIKYEKYIPLITNPVILTYLTNRFTDSTDNIETYKRIKLGIEEKPKCPICGKPVTFVGKKNKMFTKYCSNECAGKSDETINKKKQTQLENWGDECCYNSDKYKEKLKTQYGVEYTAQRKDVIDKRKQSLIDKFGTTSLYYVPEIQNKIIESYIKKFGYDNPFKSPDVKQKAYEQLKINGKLGTSKQENEIYNWLIELGYNVERFYRCDKFPYNVDFYLIDYDLFVEFQGSQYHHKSAYLGTKEDKEEIKILQQKNNIRKQVTGKDTQYASMINVWTNLDVSKRNYANDHNINFLEIYYCKSKEQLQQQIELWINCKYNKKILFYDEEYLTAEFNKCKKLHINDSSVLVYNKRNLAVDIVKYFQENIFFKKEKELYANNPIVRRKLIQNRIKYLDKLECDITPGQLITGFKKSGIYFGYSHFNPEWTNWFINEYNIKTIYDPCGGWGHHMLGMLSCDKIIYNDINNETCNNVKHIKDYFKIDNLIINCSDGTEYIPEDVDAFFMCPPYYNVEIYNEDNKFIDIQSYQIFLNKIFDIWNKNQAKIFGIVIREDFEQYFNEKWAKKIEILNKKTHLLKERKNKEYFYIFEKEN